MNMLDWGVIALYLISISWLWWNLTGFMSTVIMARVLSGWDKQPGKEVPLEPSRINWPVVYSLVWGSTLF